MGCNTSVVKKRFCENRKASARFHPLWVQSLAYKIELWFKNKIRII